MNLHPRRADNLLEFLVGFGPPRPEQVGAFMRAKRALMGDDVSIWRMELPNESYLAPRAAFWFVSNEGHLARGLKSSHLA